MKQEIYQDGKLRMTIESTDGACDIITMPKVLVKNCSMSAEGFDDLVMSFYKNNVSHTEAYRMAESVHEHYFGRPRYTDHGSYKSSYSYRHKK